MKKIGLLLLIVMTFSFQSFSGDRKVEVLEVLYNQQNYRLIVRKADKMISKKGYEDNELVHLFKAVALAKLAEDENYSRFNKDAIIKSTDAFESYFELDKQFGFEQESSCLLEDLREIYKISTSISIKSEAYDYLFAKEKIPRVIQKRQVIVVKAKPGKPVSYPENFKASEVDTVCEQPYIAEHDKMIDYAKKFIGVPYVYGGTGDGGFDCSGYTQYILGRYGHDLPRSARTQKEEIKPIKIHEAKKGDLIFFSNNKSKNNITHVGIVISEEGEELTMIHASSSQGIMITNVDSNSYWKPRLVAAGRSIKTNEG
jgi:peptidoglycan DL-endopeptidase CwlO